MQNIDSIMDSRTNNDLNKYNQIIILVHGNDTSEGKIKSEQILKVYSMLLGLYADFNLEYVPQYTSFFL